MCDELVWSFEAITSVNWLEVIRTLATITTAIIAFLALRNWQRQDKAKRQAEFIDALIEAAHTYTAEMSKPVTLMEFAKIGMISYAPIDGEDRDVKGAIAYIKSNGARDKERWLDALQEARPSVIKLRSLAAKGQVFNFDNYGQCQEAVEMLTWHFKRIEAFVAGVASPTWNWDNPMVLKHLKDMMAIEADHIRESIKDNNILLIEFATKTYKQIYG
ncbi:MAG: hypothetical protein V7651_05600 [Hyphomonas oceanitis]|uniref:hypothetical protein n=1 Tax=Hyphomonas oceanitis TaxID=81033 RepID=UPI0030029FF2